MTMNNEEQAALDTVMGFLDSYARGDVEACMSAIAVSTPILLMGTNESEVFKTVEEVRDAFTRDSANMQNMRWGEPRNVDVVSTSMPPA
jgi:hypothetical protein